MERDHSPICDSTLTNKMHKRQKKHDDQLKDIAKYTKTYFDDSDFTITGPLYIRNDLVNAGWHVNCLHDCTVHTTYKLGCITSAPIIEISPGHLLNPIDDKIVELAIKTEETELHHEVTKQVNCIRRCLSNGKSMFIYEGALMEETKSILAKTGYACIQLWIDGKRIQYGIIPKEQYDSAKTKIAAE